MLLDLWATYPEVDPVPDPVCERCVDGFVELQQHLKGQLGGDLLGLTREEGEKAVVLFNC